MWSPETPTVDIMELFEFRKPDVTEMRLSRHGGTGFDSPADDTPGGFQCFPDGASFNDQIVDLIGNGAIATVGNLMYFDVDTWLHTSVPYHSRLSCSFSVYEEKNECFVRDTRNCNCYIEVKIAVPSYSIPSGRGEFQ